MTRILSIGDIHGCDTALKTLVEFVPVLDNDLLVTLGDYVDRGPHSCQVLDWLIQRHETGQLVALRGNHELMMLDAREGEDMLSGWRSVGGDATLQSYARPGKEGCLGDVPPGHWEFLQYHTQRYYETATHFFVHANVLPDWPLEEQPDEVIFWQKFHDTPPHLSGKIMICGHTPQVTYLPRNIGHAVCLDTWIYRNGWLTCLDPVTGEYWQANQCGESRRGTLAN